MPIDVNRNTKKVFKFVFSELQKDIPMYLLSENVVSSEHKEAKITVF